MSREAKILAEYSRAVEASDPDGLAWAMMQGIGPRTILGAELVAALIGTDGRFFEFADDGEPALLVPLWDRQITGNGIEPFLLDLVAIPACDTQRFHVRRFEPTACLGMANLERAKADNTVVRLQATPWEWLLAGCEGCCLINPVGLRDMFDGVAEVLCADPNTSRAFHRWLHETDRHPVVTVERAA